LVFAFTLKGTPLLQLRPFHNFWSYLRPYVSLLPLGDDPHAPRIATTLVVTSLRAGESRLAWHMRYRYDCRDSDNPGDLGHRQWIAYVDAKNGVLYWEYLGRPPGW
jgi:hypothetical protein